MKTNFLDAIPVETWEDIKGTAKPTLRQRVQAEREGRKKQRRRVGIMDNIGNAFATCQRKRTFKSRPRIKAETAFMSRFDNDGNLITKGKTTSNE